MRMNSKLAQHLSQADLYESDKLKKDESIQPIGMGILEHGYALNEKNIAKKKLERN